MSTNVELKVFGTAWRRIAIWIQWLNNKVKGGINSGRQQDTTWCAAQWNVCIYYVKVREVFQNAISSRHDHSEIVSFTALLVFCHHHHHHLSVSTWWQTDWTYFYVSFACDMCLTTGSSVSLSSLVLQLSEQHSYVGSYLIKCPLLHRVFRSVRTFAEMTH